MGRAVSALPPIYRDCQRLLRQTEAIVMRFSRYHKYTVGTDLRQQAFTLMRTVHRAVYDHKHQHQHIQTLGWQVDDYKLTLQLTMDVGAFSQPQSVSFAQFEGVALLATAIGKQCGGWLKKIQPANPLHANSGPQSAVMREPVPQTRPTSLSARATSTPPKGQEVTP
jgi:hypothetical protein